MFYIPGFNPKGMSDEELVLKYSELSKRINYAYRFSGGNEMVAQFNAMMFAIEEEQRERTYKMIWEQRERMFPEVIETEPDLIEKPPQEEEEVARPRIQPSPARKSFSVTKTPRNDTPPAPTVRRSTTPTSDKAPRTRSTKAKSSSRSKTRKSTGKKK